MPTWAARCRRSQAQRRRRQPSPRTRRRLPRARGENSGDGEDAPVERRGAERATRDDGARCRRWGRLCTGGRRRRAAAGSARKRNGLTIRPARFAPVEPAMQVVPAKPGPRRLKPRILARAEDPPAARRERTSADRPFLTIDLFTQECLPRSLEARPMGYQMPRARFWVHRVSRTDRLARSMAPNRSARFKIDDFFAGVAPMNRAVFLDRWRHQPCRKRGSRSRRFPRGVRDFRRAGSAQSLRAAGYLLCHDVSG